MVQLMLNNESSTLTHLMSQLETLWRDLDTLFGALTADEWSRPHGPGRIFADVSAHLADFDRDVVAAGLERGVQAPWGQQRLRTPVELNDGSAAPVDDAAHTTLQARLGQMRAARHALRAAVAALSDADLARPIWLAIQGYYSA